MKNVRSITVFIAIALVLTLAFAAVPAYAEGVSAVSRNVHRYDSPNGYTLSSLTDDRNGLIFGVMFSGIYFSASGIRVTAEIYSEQNFTIDFPINEEDKNLTASQQIVKAKVFELAEKINAFVNHIDNVANTQYNGQGNLPISDIYRYNKAKSGETIEVDYDTYQMLLIARNMYDETNGAFNPAVYRLVDLWGFSSRTYLYNDNEPYDRVWGGVDLPSYPLPEQKYVDAFSDTAFTDFSQDAVTLTEQNGKYYVTKNVKSAQVDGAEFEQWLDLGGIAKGYVADGIKSMLSAEGITQFFVDTGSSSQAYGKYYNGNNFMIGTRDPYDDNIFRPNSVVTAVLSNATMSTSGQYIRKYTTDGVEYAHIVDANSGAPAQTGVKSVTIVAPSNYLASKGDCLTTALTVMGRDRIIDFMNGYLKDNGIKVIVIYETVDGQKQILSNYDKDNIGKGDSFDSFAWAVKIDENGKFSYDFDAKAPVDSHDLTWLIITLGVIVLLAVVAVIVTHFVKGGSKKIAKNVINAKRDKPFKAGDVGAYLAVVVLVIVLFMTFFGGETERITVIKMMDFSKSEQGELLFAYNVARNEWVIYSDNSNNWIIDVTEENNSVVVKFSRQVDGEEHYNVMTITRGSSVSVKMTDSICGRNQECVRNFRAITLPNRTIVCSPNRLKIISE